MEKDMAKMTMLDRVIFFCRGNPRPFFGTAMLRPGDDTPYVKCGEYFVRQQYIERFIRIEDAAEMVDRYMHLKRRHENTTTTISSVIESLTRIAKRTRPNSEIRWVLECLAQEYEKTLTFNNQSKDF